MYWGCYGISLGIFGIHFIYRYLVASGNKLSESFNSWKIGIWFSIPLIFGSIWAFDGYVMCAPTNSTTEFIRESVNKTFGLEEDEFVYLGPQIFQVSGNNTIIFNLKPSTGLAFNVLTVDISFFTIFYFGIKCYRCINSMVKQSASSKSSALQKQLFYSLVVQTLFPILLVELPFTLVLILCIFNINDDLISGIAVMAIALYPAIDPLPNIFIIRDYRRAVFGYFMIVKNRLLCRKHVVQDVGRSACYTDGPTFTNVHSASHGQVTATT